MSPHPYTVSHFDHTGKFLKRKLALPATKVPTNQISAQKGCWLHESLTP
ncbi:hypothetical protein ECSTECMHI813_1071 [Escherichia coli STEC_MHI813]|nr:hypothetical protein ECSTECMHI813_1071 [Escherichia coli STEC_MHI813]